MGDIQLVLFLAGLWFLWGGIKLLKILVERGGCIASIVGGGIMTALIVLLWWLM